VLDSARRLERAAYEGADRIVVLSGAFTRNLLAKGVPERKIAVVYNPATRTPRSLNRRPNGLRVLGMGNIGFSQGLAPLVEAYERSDAIRESEIPLVITGDGVAAEDVRSRIRSERVKMPGIVDDDRLEEELCHASIGLVSQHYDGAEFNTPSKLMNFMTYGLPILAAVNPDGEVARIVKDSDAGWVVDSSDPGAFPAKVADLASAPDEVARRGEAARVFAEHHFGPTGIAERFERSLDETLQASSR